MKGAKSKKAIKPPKRNIWKIVAIIFLALFCLAILRGFVRFHQVRSSFAPATVEEMNFARETVLGGMNVREDDYDVQVSKKVMRRNERGSAQTHVRHLQVSARNDTTRSVYLVNLDTGKIDLRSTTVVSGQLVNISSHKRGWFDER